MIGLDTNVVVRYLVQDEPVQSAVAAALIDGLTDVDPGFISLVTAVEIYWVLHRAYKVGASHCVDVLQGLIDARELRVEQSDVVRVAVRETREGADFADAVIAELGRLAGCEHTVTFDRGAARLAKMQFLGG